MPAHLLDFNPSKSGEEVAATVFGPFVQLVEENVPLLLGLTGLGICILVGSLVVKFVAGQGGPRNPHLTPYERAAWTEAETRGGGDMGMGEGPQ